MSQMADNEGHSATSLDAIDLDTSAVVPTGTIPTPQRKRSSHALVVANLSDPRSSPSAGIASRQVLGTSEAARSAFKENDAETSIAVHKAKAAAISSAEEKHGGTGSEYIKSVVFGGLDGIITTFSIVAAVAGASLSPEVTLMMGFANLLADGISMGLGDYLSEAAELDYVRSERKREAWEMDNYPEGELSEMVELYVEKGVERKDAETILATMAKYKEFFVDHMMVMELGQQTPGDDENPAMNGLVTFLSFIAFGSVPMWAYLIMWGAKYTNRGGMFGIACAATAATMYVLGAVQAKISRQPVFRTGMSLMLNGCLAAAAAYLVGWGLEHAIGSGDNC